MRHQLPAYSPLSARAIAGALLGNGARSLSDLQQLLAQTFDARAAVLTSSGTHALQLALQAAQHRLGGHTIVALPAFTCYDVATAAVALQQPVLLYDVDPATLAPDLDSLRAALHGGANIIVVTPLYGIPVAWPPLQQLAQEFGALLIEDAAQGQGAVHHGRTLGSIGELSVLSFGRGKGWTGGGGGALLLRGAFDVADAARIAPTLETHARWLRATKVVAQWLLGRPTLYGIPTRVPWLGLAETIYHPPTQPRQMDPAGAQLVLNTAPLLEREAAVRRQTATYYTNELRDCTGVALITAPPDSTPGYGRFPVLMRGGSAHVVNTGGARRGVLPSYPTTLQPLTALQPLLRRKDAVPGAERLAEQLVTLPVHSLLSDADRRLVVEVVKRAAEQATESVQQQPGNAQLESAQR